ncbi:MAG: CBS domain-containing protein [Candidatus Aenigmarchaeota archaeon]|nr:CBS domain-containing protein [Candidatus Aenigmarchaeota archaeon]
MKTDIKSLGPDENIEKAAKIMRDNKIGSVVVKSDKNVVGIVTTSDIVYKHVADKRGNKLQDIMTTDLVNISPRMNIEAAAKLMVQKKIEKILVFDKGSLVGIITNNDVLNVEPALFEVLLERLKMGGVPPADMSEYAQCEACGNYDDSVGEIEGEYICEECKG